ncbi:methyltransferase [[Actinomadura] parvosata subsp. kistnae]|uniref:Methyltransferase n=1 Tax=[Actinomadura] parvosata subsp. kistnae TaxID=1909395 RepID=A0A1V0AJB0_9ACTN|nr:methyltransferase [Nonomuraea sp. ATCC 55076]
MEEVAADLPPGRALDLAAGEGRNALWLAERGWSVIAVDFSAVALERARSLAGQRLGEQAGRVELVKADVRDYVPEPGAFDLVVIAYLQVAQDVRRQVMRSAAGAVAAGGLLLVVAHDSDNLAHGTGGPQDPAVLYRANDVAADVDGAGLRVVRARARARPVEGAARDAIDAFFVAVRDAAPPA